MNQMRYLEEITTKKAVVLIIPIGFLVYFNSLGNGFVWDDTAQVVNNTLVHSLSKIPDLFVRSTFGTPETSLKYYRPLMSSLFAVIYTLFGSQTLFFHLFQILLHITNSILVFLLIKKFLEPKISLFLSLIFLIHPMNVEATSYISSLMEPLFFFFGILALLLSSGNLDLKSKVSMSVLLLLSLLSKETGILFISMIGFYLVVIKRKDFLAFVPVAMVSLVVYLILRIGVAGFFLSESAENPIFKVTLIERLITIPKVILFYIQTFFLPINLAVLQEWTVKSANIADFYFPFAILVILFASFLGLFIHLQKHQSPLSNIFLFFLVWLVSGLALHSQIFPLDMTAADRWFYFPMVGLLGMIGVEAQELKTQNLKLRTLGLWVAIIIIIFFSLRTFIRNFDWKDNLALFAHDSKISESADLEFNLATALLAENKVDEAKIHFSKAIDHAPNPGMRAYYQGIYYSVEGNYESAKESYKKAIDTSELPLAYAAISNLIYINGTYEEALSFTENALKKQSENAQLWLNLALLKYEIGNQKEALEAARKAYELSPTTDGLFVLKQIERGEAIYK